MYFILDEAVRQITDQVTNHKPERGGALLGIPGRPVITRFLYDDKAETTYTSYQPSDDLGEVVQLLEMEGLELKGIIHSHPGNLDRPSSGDQVPLKDGLRVNPHLSHFLMPIITQMETSAPHELASGDGKISFFLGQNSRDGVTLSTKSITEIPLLRDLESLARHLKSDSDPQIIIGNRDGIDQIMGVVSARDVDLFILVNEYYPFSAPTVLISRGGADTEYLPISWSMDTPEVERLSQSIRTSLYPDSNPTISKIDTEAPTNLTGEWVLVGLMAGLISILVKSRGAKWAR